MKTLLTVFESGLAVVYTVSAYLFSIDSVAAADSNWAAHLGDKASNHYSTLKQITPKNVAKLEVAWTYRSGGTDTNDRSQIQCNPPVIDRVLYGTSPDLQVFAIDATSGTELWRFNPSAVKGFSKGGVNRGLVYWAESRDRRIFYANDHFLHALNAGTGERIRAFDRKTGKELWNARLPAAGYATPATYSVNGRHYVVIACGGGKIGTRSATPMWRLR